MAKFRTKAKTGPPTPLVRLRPAENGNFVAFSAEGDGFSVYVHRDVLEFIERESRGAAPNEAIGLLAGRVCRDPTRGPYTVVTAADSARPGEVEASPSHVHISAEGNAGVRRRLEEMHPDREVVGWYHSHPRYPAHFSHVDITEQSTWGDPSHVGIVFSGMEDGEPFGVYCGPDAVRLTCSRPQPRADAAGAVFFKPESGAAERRVPKRTQTERPRPPVAAITPHRPSTPTRPIPSGGLIRLAPRLFFALLLLGLAAAVVWLHVRVRAIEDARPGKARADSTSPSPAPPLQTPTPEAPAPSPAFVSDANTAAGLDPQHGAETNKQPGEMNDAPREHLPVFINPPEVMPPANPLNGRARSRNNKHRRKKKKCQSCQ